MPAWPQLAKDPPLAHASISERARAVESACRTAMQLLAQAPDREARLRRTDPVPPSTTEILRRLAAAAHDG